MTSNYQKLYFWCQWQQRGTDLKLSKLCHRSLLMAPFLQLHSNKKGKTFLFFCFFFHLSNLFTAITSNKLQLLAITRNYLHYIWNYQTTDKKTFLLSFVLSSFRDLRRPLCKCPIYGPEHKEIQSQMWI